MTAYWESTGKHQEISDKLELLVPTSGSVRDPANNPALETFRRASNACYDIFNNGGGNRDDDIAEFFGQRTCEILSDAAESAGAFPAKEMHRRTESRVDKIIMAAAEEQKLA